MKAIHIKLWRDLKRLRAQVATIAMVVAIGVAGFVGMFSVHQSLQGTRDDFYLQSRIVRSEFDDAVASAWKCEPITLKEKPDSERPARVILERHWNLGSARCER